MKGAISAPGVTPTFEELAVGQWFVPVPATPPLECTAVLLYKKISPTDAVRVMPNSNMFIITFPDNQHCWKVW